MSTHTHIDPHTDGHVGQHEAGVAPLGGPVVVDIGGDVSALVVRMPADLLGHELHVRMEGHTHTVHTGIWERELGDRRVVVAVFPALTEGTYTLLDPFDGHPIREVTLAGGRVADLDLT
jgi:hypothetical protein